MQKHERACLAAAQEEAAKLSGNLTVSTRTGKTKLRLILRGPKGERAHVLASSPSRAEDCISFARQWVRRAAKEVM